MRRSTVEDPAVTAQGTRTTYLIKQLEQAIRAEMGVMTREYGLTALQYTALTVLQRHPGMSGAQLARRSFVSPQAGSEMIAKLEAKGLITREPDDANRRILRISLTAEGHRIVGACESWMGQLEQEMLGTLGAADINVLRTSLAACVLALSPRRAGGS